MESRPLWTCAHCARTFANPNQTHTCAPLRDLDSHFARSDPSVRAVFNRILLVLDPLGPYTVLPEKTRIALHVRMSFAAFTPRPHRLDGHLILARRADSPKFHKIETYSPRNILHALRLVDPSEVDEELSSLLSESYQVGAQLHRRPR